MGRRGISWRSRLVIPCRRSAGSRSGAAFLRAFPVVFLLATLSYILAGQSFINSLKDCLS